MKNANLRRFNIDGKVMQFDGESYKRLHHEFARCNGKKLSFAKYDALIADAIHVGESAVKSWRYESGPGDMDTIKALAAFWNVNYLTLLRNGERQLMCNKNTDRQLEAIRRIYGSIIEFLHEFLNTDGFNDLWLEFVESGNSNPEEAIIETADAKIEVVKLACKKEYFDLQGLDIYDELLNYIDGTLLDTYDGKCSYAYRFEALIENRDGTHSGISTKEDYAIAMKALDEIMEKHVWG